MSVQVWQLIEDSRKVRKVLEPGNVRIPPKKIMKIGKIRCPIHEDLWIRKDIHTFRGLLRNYPLVNVDKTMENHHFIAGYIHYFYGHFPSLCQFTKGYLDKICTMASHGNFRRSLFSNRWNFLGASRQRGQKYGRNEPWDVVLRYDTHFPSFSIQFR